MKKHTSLIQKISELIHTHEGLILLLIFHFLLRLPNLFEPYWYGDEGIYLTIGTALRHGAKLYADIIDHKTPLIYYFAMVPSQFWFRILNITWMTGSIVLFFNLTKKLRFSVPFQYIATILFILLTSLPWLEGNIPNGELFVMGFVLLGAWLYMQTNFFARFMREKEKKSRHELLMVFGAGICLALGVLTKVPAVLDVMAFGSVGILIGVSSFKQKQLTKDFWKIFQHWLALGLGVVTPIVISVLYYFLRGTLSSYIDFGLLYNFRYAGSWGLPFTNQILVFLFSLKGKLLILLGGIFLTAIAQTKRVSPTSKFLIIWTLTSWFGATLSSRPYPHYLLQLVPATVLLVAWTLNEKKISIDRIFTGGVTLLIVATVLLLKFSFYPTIPYYSRFFQFLTKNITKEQYIQQYDGLMSENYELAKILITSKNPQIFIWGTNPTLYALAKKYPTGRFTVSFHIKDFPGAFEETYEDLIAVEPEYIVVMKNEDARFDNFFAYLYQNYVLIKETQRMELYKKIPSKLLAN